MDDFSTLVGGIAGGAYFTSAIIGLVGGPEERPIARMGYLIAFPLALLCAMVYWLRDGGRHRVRSRSGKAGADEDGGEIDVRQIAYRQLAVSHDAEQKNRQHDQRGHDWSPDETLCDIHISTQRSAISIRSVELRTSHNRQSSRVECAIG